MEGNEKVPLLILNASDTIIKIPQGEEMGYMHPIRSVMTCDSEEEGENGHAFEPSVK